MKNHASVSPSCCTPSALSRKSGSDGRSLPDVYKERFGFGEGGHRIEQRTIMGGAFWMGDAQGDGAFEDGEQPVHAVFLDTFHIDVTSVTNDDFARFVAATGYITSAERHGVSAVFYQQVLADAEDIVGPFPGTPWWLGVRGAHWRHPGGRGSSIEGFETHPVVHVSWHDAMAYCHWAGRTLPSEAQWEFAARGGISQARYPWGDDLMPGAAWQCNIWQGRFPEQNSIRDGWRYTAPVRTFDSNGYGLWQCVGNVWEWCSDWFARNYYARSPLSNPRGAESGNRRVMRGGSFLCHDSYCNRYRNAARASNTPDSATSNLGFRTAGGAVTTNP